jgi:6,7-dimethyl-8-ribityllumazine synthase
MSDRIDEIESRLRELGPKQAADGGSPAESAVEPTAEPPVPEQPEDSAAAQQPEPEPPAPSAEAEPEPDLRPEAVPELEQEPAAQHAEGELRVPDGYQVLSGGVDGKRAVGVVVSRFNGEITDRLLQRALDELEEVGVPREAIMVMPVPGAFELPLAAMALAKTRRYACIVALGCVIRGETPHFELIAHEAASGLQLAAIETGVPVAFGVLTVESREQAEQRIDKAAEAVRSALEMADVFSQLRASAAGPLH